MYLIVSQFAKIIVVMLADLKLLFAELLKVSYPELMTPDSAPIACLHGYHS